MIMDFSNSDHLFELHVYLSSNCLHKNYAHCIQLVKASSSSKSYCKTHLSHIYIKTVLFRRNEMDAHVLINLLVFFAQVSFSATEDIAPEKPTKLSSKNFHDILSMDDPWVVVFIDDYSEKKELELIALATSVVGLVRIGYVDMDDADSDDLIEAKRINKPQIRVYGYGEDNKERPSKATEYDEAINMALESYPDTLERITDETIPAFYSRAIKESKPRKLPIILFSEDDYISPQLRYLALNLKEVFAFSILVKPSYDLLQNFTITILPQLAVLFHLNLKTGAFEMIKYDREAFGPPNFVNLLKFLVGVQNEVGDKKHQKTLERLMFGEEQGSKPDPDKYGVQQLTANTQTKICGSKSLAVCVIAFLTADDENDIKAKEEILDKVRKSKTLRDHHIRYSWINASCHQNIADAFHIDMTQLPYVIAVKRSKNLFTNHVGSFSFDDLREFLLSVLSGRRPMVSYNKFPRFLTKDCRLTKLKCKDGICDQNSRNKRKSKRGPSLSRGSTEEL